jgi:phosphorylcholine metabolism protein LicD
MGVKSFLRSFRITRGLYKILADNKSEKIREKKRIYLQKFGKETIKAIQQILQSENIMFFFDMGTLLGIVREGRLLGHDLDIDVGCIVHSEQEKERVSAILLNNSCSLKYRYEVEGIGIVEESYLLNNIKFDVNYYSTDNDKSICYLLYTDPAFHYEDSCMSVVKLTSKKIKNIELYSWGDICINIPQNPEQYLTERYGDRWRIPDKNYVYWKGPSTTPTNFKGYRTVDV